MKNKEIIPQNTVYIDVEARKLIVTKVDVGNSLGREVQGKLVNNSLSTDHERIADYSCTLKTWADIWRDKMPRVDASKMKIG